MLQNYSKQCFTTGIEDRTPFRVQLTPLCWCKTAEQTSRGQNRKRYQTCETKCCQTTYVTYLLPQLRLKSEMKLHDPLLCYTSTECG